MKIFRKVLRLIILTIIIITTLVVCIPKGANTSSRITEGQSVKKLTSHILNVTQGEPVKAGVVLFNFNDPYISLVRKSLESIQSENEGEIEFTFFDGKGNQDIQDQVIDKLLQSDIDVLLLNLVNTGSSTIERVINKIKQKNIPVVLFNVEPTVKDAIKSYGKAFIVATNVEHSGILQGKILVDEWNNNKAGIDKNRDNIMQYIMLKGQEDNTAAEARTKYSISTINNAGIKTEELAMRIGKWDKETAKKAMEPLLLRYGNRIEAIISNNDSMAIGAIEALQEYGYNKGDKTRTIPVVGIDAIPPAQDLIKKGFMTGTVRQDYQVQADAIYKIAMNLVNGKNPLEGTNYKSDNEGIMIFIPYEEYK